MADVLAPAGLDAGSAGRPVRRWVVSVDAVRVGAVEWTGPQGHDVSSVAAAERPSREATRGAPQWGRFRGDGADLENIVDDKSGPGRGGGDVRLATACRVEP